MINIHQQDIHYAFKQVLGFKTEEMGKLEWENFLKKNSNGFWRFLVAEMDSAAKIAQRQKKSFDKNGYRKEMWYMRKCLTIIFAAAYHARQRYLPKVSLEKAVDIKFRAQTSAGKDQLRQSVFTKIRESNLGWEPIFLETLNDRKLHWFSYFTVFVAIETLFESFASGRQDDKFYNWPTDQEQELDEKDNPHEHVQIMAYRVKDAVDFSQIGGQKEAKEKVMSLASALSDPALYYAWGTKPPRGICLYGPPGTGKTLLAKALASSVNLPFYNVPASQIISMWVGRSARNVDEVFKKARKTGGVVFFDEVDSLSRSRKDHTNYSKDVINALNRNLDGFEASDRVVVFFATNHLEDIDEAVIRSGRIDRIIEVPLPDPDGRRQIFSIHVTKAEEVAKRRLFELSEFELKKIIDQTQGFNGADIAELVRRTLASKVKEHINGLRPNLVSYDDLMRELNSFEHAKKANKKIGF